MNDKLTIKDMMLAYSEDAVDMGKKIFNKTLDYSEDSLEAVENILKKIYETIPKSPLSKLVKRKPTEDDLNKMAKIWGGYVGEVIRRKWGGEWTNTTAAQSGATITLRVKGTDIFPPAKVYKRLKNGEEDNIWFYYKILKQGFENSSGKN